MTSLKLPPIDTAKAQLAGLVVGAVALLAAVILGFAGHAEGFFQSYLVSYLFWVGISLGSLALLFIVHLAGGSWGAIIVRPLEAAASAVPLFALLFVPIILGMNDLYPWVHADYVAAEPTVAAKTGYLNVAFFIVRAVIIFAIFTLGAYLYRNLSKKQDDDEGTAPRSGYRMKNLGGLWIVVYILTMTFAAFDWSMSVTPTWYSGVYPGIIMAGQVVSALAVVILVMINLASKSPTIDRLLTPKRLQDLGNMLMAVIMFWAYLQVSQLIIQWSNNIVETASWYVVRFNPTWIGLATFILFFGFFAPFIILFSRWVKRTRRALSIVAAWALVVQFINYFWFIVPGFGRQGFQLTVLDLLILVGLGGIWVAVYARTLTARNVLPANDPRLVKVVAEHHA